MITQEWYLKYNFVASLRTHTFYSTVFVDACDIETKSHQEYESKEISKIKV